MGQARDSDAYALLTLDEVAERLRRHRRTVEKMLQSGEFGADAIVRTGPRRVFVTLAGLRAYIDANRDAPLDVPLTIAVGGKRRTARTRSA